MVSDRLTDVDLEQLLARARGRRIALPGYFTAPVKVEQATPVDGSVFLQVRMQDASLRELPIDPEELQRALNSTELPPQAVVSPEDFFLLVESARIRLAYSYDPFFALNLTGIEVLPHQLEAVYERMLPRVLLRFLLADDPGAGKTIMAGLLLKELKLRGAVERILVLCPAPLTIQWEDELRSKFDEPFERMTSERVKGSLGGNPWEMYPRCIASLDFAKRDEVRDRLLEAPWDLVVIDEAHKCSARTDGDKVTRTRRYELAERLAAKVERVLLLTATPHQGNEDQFEHFLRLLDPDQFVDLQRDKSLIQLEGNPWYLRRMKEDLRDFDGHQLFTERHAHTERFELSPPEEELYREVNEYIDDFLPRQTGKRRTSVALARMVFQRRLASSLGAIASSLTRRRDRFRDILVEIEALPPSEREQALAHYRLVDVDAEQDMEDQDEEQQEKLLDAAMVSDRIDELRAEVTELERLVEKADSTRQAGTEAKLEALERCLDRGQFSELNDGRGKLLIFTEHRDTLDYLRGKLERWGFSTTAIHGGMNPQERRQRQDDFLRNKQVCVATEAAGEGINLQFCHLMINYDLPWNPVRLEQRMGRIHRIGQEYDVHIFNFVATNTVEGAVLERLLVKLETIKQTLGGRVYDVIGDLLKLNEVNLEDILREAAFNPKHRDEYLDQIERIDPDRLREYEEAVGIALAKSHVSLEHIRGQEARSEERRLVPEYVEEYFERAAHRVGLNAERRSGDLWRVEHVPQQLRADDLYSSERFGRPATRYPKFSFRKEITRKGEHLDAELISPGHPLFAALDEVLMRKLEGAAEGVTRYLDPFAPGPYRVHFFEVEVEAGTVHAGYETAEGRLVAVTEDPQGRREITSPDILHDLTPVDRNGELDVGSEHVDDLRKWAMVHVQQPMAGRVREERTEEVHVRREYLEESFELSVNKARNSWLALAQRVEKGEDAARLARDEAHRRLDAIEQRRKDKLEGLNLLEVVLPGRLRYLGTAVVDPTAEPVSPGMRRDDEIEAAAMKAAMSYERECGWEPTDVSKHHDGSGFDIRSLGPEDQNGKRPVRRIEVKGRAREGMDVELTPNEWRQAARHRETYWLYVVWNARDGERARLKRIQDPSASLARDIEELREVRGYRVPAGAIRSLAA